MTTTTVARTEGRGGTPWRVVARHGGGGRHRRRPGGSAPVRRPTPAALLAALLVAAIVGTALAGAGPAARLVPAAAAAQETYPVPASGSWEVQGHGWGHAHGMGQWSAQGAARAGRTGEQIVDWAYPGTTRRNVGNPTIRVRLLWATSPAVVLRAPAGGTLAVTGSAPAAHPATVTVDHARVAGGTVDASSADGVQVRRPDGSWVWYRGSVRLASDGSGRVTATNHVDLRRYLYGVVPRESPSWFHQEALRAQALAARSYALAVSRPRDGHDICDTTQCQVYGGRATVSAAGSVKELETASTRAAVDSTDGWIVSYGGQPAFTQFSSSTGGWTRAGSKPYLVAQRDPWSGTDTRDTVHSWTATLAVSTVQRSCPAGGRLRSMTVTSRDGNGDWGGRVTGLRLDCTTGTATVTGDGALRFGMRSSWWRIRAQAPTGRLDAAEPGPGSIRVAGWSADADEPSRATRVRVVVDDRPLVTTTAARARPDVSSVFPALAPSRGYDVTVRVPAGARRVCVWAVDTQGGPDTQVGCRDVVVPGGPAFGYLDSVTGHAGGGLRVSGWAADPDAGSAPVPLSVSVGGRDVTWSAGTRRPDVAGAYPLYGDRRGFSGTMLAPSGRYEVCVGADAVGAGGDVALGCRTVDVPGGRPSGWLDRAYPGPRSVTVSGWAFDPDLGEAAATARIEVAGRRVDARAGDPSPHVDAVYPAVGPDHGYRATVAASPGSHQACVTAQDHGGGESRVVGCRTVTVPSGTPFGRLDAATARPGGVLVQGWVSDPDTSDAVDVHVYVNGRHAGTGVADGLRPDVAAVHPGWGSRRGYSIDVPSPAGRVEVCTWAINRLDGGTTNPRLGCRTVDVPA